MSMSDSSYRAISHQLGDPELPTPAPAHVHCVAAILWWSHENPVTYNLQNIVTKDLLRLVLSCSDIFISVLE